MFSESAILVQVIRLKAALNEKDMELIELREQHMQLVARSQEARANWETALDTKDRAITQLEEALESSKRALDAAHRQAAAVQSDAGAAVSAVRGKVQALEAALEQAHATITQQSEAISDQARHLEAARHATTQEGAAADARVRALQQELASCQVQQGQLQRELGQLRAMTAEKDERLADAAGSEQQLRQQTEQLRQQLREAEVQQHEQPSRMQQQLAELSQQLQVVQHRAAAKEASSRKYKEAVRAFKHQPTVTTLSSAARRVCCPGATTKLQERDDALAQRQSQILELHTELSQLQRLLKLGPSGSAAAAAGGFRSSSSRMSGGLQQPGSPGAAHSWGGGAKLERLRVEVHGFHLELAALQAQLSDKDAVLQRALGDASQLDSERAAAAARAEEATRAALSLERQLREAHKSLREAQQAGAELTERLAAAEARVEGLQADQARWLRAEGGARAQLEEAQQQLQEAQQQRGQLQQQVKEGSEREADAIRRVQQLEMRVEGLQEKLDASASEAGQLIRRADRHETATATLQAQLDSTMQAAREYEQAVRESEAQLHDAGRQLQELERRGEELARRCEAAERTRQQAEVQAAQQLAAAEGRAAAAERRAADLDSQLLLLGRALRDAEGAALDWQARAGRAEQARQELGGMMEGNEAAVKQLQADLAQLQLSHSSERAAAQHAEQQLRAALSDAQAAKAAAEVRLAEGERQLSDARGHEDSQERLVGMLRQQLAEQGRAAAAAAELEASVQALEAALAEQRHTVSQLRAAAAAEQVVIEAVAPPKVRFAKVTHAISATHAVYLRSKFCSSRNRSIIPCPLLVVPVHFVPYKSSSLHARFPRQFLSAFVKMLAKAILGPLYLPVLQLTTLATLPATGLYAILGLLASPLVIPALILKNLAALAIFAPFLLLTLPVAVPVGFMLAALCLACEICKALWITFTPLLWPLYFLCKW
ncbi:hypothetical protein COO60DRAFT_1462988 [Scenedesmus sp. NREL 46B-D3]|nr:hypothetical protein COO60DRAFT_1462988 [Scenedesmus sp. NREL 46B-D3]